MEIRIYSNKRSKNESLFMEQSIGFFSSSKLILGNPWKVSYINDETVLPHWTDSPINTRVGLIADSTCWCPSEVANFY